MLDLEQRAATNWLTQVFPARPVADWPPAVRPIELDGDAAALLAELGQALDAFRDDQRDLLSQCLRSQPLANLLRDVLAQLGAARQFRLLHWLGERGLKDSPMIAAVLTSGNLPEAETLRAAIRAYARRALLNRIFAADRLAALKTATETALQEDAPCHD